MIPGDLLSAFPHRQFHTLPGLLDSWAALPNSYPNACMPMQGGSLYHFYDGLWYDPDERRTHDLPCERRTRYRLSQPDTVPFNLYADRTYLFLSSRSQYRANNSGDLLEELAIFVTELLLMNLPQACKDSQESQNTNPNHKRKTMHFKCFMYRYGFV